MKLIKAHIENFGKISDEDFIFDSSFNEFYKENGWGKSTLAAFIKVMLFGFDNERARDELSNERKRYKPWQGGTYGGSLWIEAKGKKYIISRTFGTKDKEDEFVLRDADTMLSCDDFTKNIGEELFEIDLAAFSRTIFISQNDIYTEATGNINAKIGNLTDNTDDINNFETVDKKLADIINAMSPTRKTGSIAKLVDELNDLRIEIKNATVLDESIDRFVKAKEEARIRYNTLKEKQQVLLDKKKEVSKYKDLKIIRDGYIRHTNSVSSLDTKLKAIKSNLPNKDITTDVVNKTLKNIDELKKYESYREAYCLKNNELLEYNELKKLFSGNILEQVNEDIFEEKIARAEKLEELEKNIEATCVTDAEITEYEELKALFEKTNIDEHTIDLKVSNWTRKNEIKSAITLKEMSYKSQKASIDKEYEVEKNKANNKNYVPLIISVMCAIVGFALLPLGFYYTVALLLASIGGVVAFILINGKNKNKLEIADNNYEKNLATLVDLKTEIENDNFYIEKSEKEMRDFLGAFNVDYIEEYVINELFTIKQNIKRYKELCSKMSNIDKSADEKASKYRNELDSFFLILKKDIQGLESHKIKQIILELKNQYILYKKYKEQISKYNESVEECNSLQKQIDDFFKEYEIKKSEDITKQLLDLNINIRNLADIFVDYDEAKNKLSEYIEKNNITDDIINMKLDETEEKLLDIDKETEEIILEIEEVNNTITSYNNSLNELREKRDIISEKEESLLTLEEKIGTDKKKYKLIKKTKELLEISKNNLTARYMKPILDSFTKYYGIISEDISDVSCKYSIDAKINITANEGGIPRRVDLLSEGTKDLVYICMRLALVDAMYSDEKPFILFDDPFVNFDDEKVKGSLKLLEEVSKEYQIIYFTCHNSRK